MLGKAAFGNTTKGEKPFAVDDDVPMSSHDTKNKHLQAKTCSTEQQQDNSGSSDVGQQREEEANNNDTELGVHAWQRDPERERDKILGFFVIAGQPIPRDIFHSIMLFIPAFPYYFMLRSVCSQWLYEFQEQIYGNVTYLSLVDDGRPKYYLRRCGDDGKQELVSFKSIDFTGKGCRLDEVDYRTKNYNRTAIFEFLANVFPNVKHLRLDMGTFFCRPNLNHCLRTLLPKLTRLETFDVLGTNQAYLKRHAWGGSTSITELELDTIARSLPSSTKNLNFIGVYFNYSRALELLTIFSETGRSVRDMSYPSHSLNNRTPITVDIQHLTLPYLCLNSSYSPNGPTLKVDWERIKQMYSHFEVSIVGPNTDSSRLQVPVVSYVNYLNHMSKKEGIVLSHMGCSLRTETKEILEATIDMAVREYPYFCPLLSLPALRTKSLLSPYTKLDANFVFQDASTGVKALELLTNPDRMKYPELVLNVNSPLDWNSGCTLLSHLISQSSNEEGLTLIKALVEDYKASLAVNGVRNCLAELMATHLPHTTHWTNLMKYLLSIKPELIVLGNPQGIIVDDQRNLPLIQLFLQEHHASDCLGDVKYLVSAGASLTQVDEDGNNVLHAAYKSVRIDVVEYLQSVCPENLLFERNNNGQTPIEQIFPPNSYLKHLDITVQIRFLRHMTKLPCFKNQPLQSYKTSCGNLLHSALSSSNIQIIQWLLSNGFDGNALNEKGENALFYSKTSQFYGFNPARPGSNPTINQDSYVDENASELIKSGAKVDLENNEGQTVVTSALRNNNYALINIIVQKPSISSKPLSTLLSPRMQNGFNALHYIFNKMAKVTNFCTSTSKKQKVFQFGSYPVAKHCALLCLEHYPEMLYERAESSQDEDLKDISGVSPLQILLKASKGLFLLNELSIKLSAIANKPVFSSKSSDVVAPIPVMYLALEVAIETPMFDKLMNYTNNVLVRDETQRTKPNLLHIAAERDASLCQCIIKHWKKKYSNKEELSKLISMPLENDVVDGRKSRNAALIACMLGSYEIFSVLWPYTKSHASQFDNPVHIALQKKDHSFAISAVMHHGVVPSKAHLHRIIRKCLVEHSVDAVHESKFVSLMVQTEEEEPRPTWLEMLVQVPSEVVDTEEGSGIQRLSTMQLIVSEIAGYMFSWLVRHYCDETLLDRAVRVVDNRTGDTLLHLLTSGTHYSFVGNDLSSILLSVVDRFKVEGDAPTETKGSKTKLPSLDHLNTKDLTEFVNFKNKIGRTCLHNVAVNSLQPILHDLLVFGANLEIKDSDGKTPLELMGSSATFIVKNFLNMRDGKSEKRKATRKKEADDESDNVEEDDDGDYGSSNPRKRIRMTND